MHDSFEVFWRFKTAEIVIKLTNYWSQQNFAAQTIKTAYQNVIICALSAGVKKKIYIIPAGKYAAVIVIK